MLVLRRKVNEAIILNKVIIIRVLGIEGDRVKLGIDAPPDIIVVREELLDEPPVGTEDKRTQKTPSPTFQPYTVWTDAPPRRLPIDGDNLIEGDKPK